MNNITKVWTIINNVCRQYRKVEKSREALDILNEAEKEIFDTIDRLAKFPTKKPGDDYKTKELKDAYNWGCVDTKIEMRDRITRLKEGDE